MTTPTPRTTQERIADYLTGGGLFNPELAIHDAVRDLLIDVRTQLDLLSSVEDGEGIVRELRECAAEAEKFGQGDMFHRAAARITLDAQEKAALQATLDEVSAAIGDVRYMDPPDGGDVPIAEQVRRMRAELASVKAERDSLGTQLEQIAHERTP